jgi:hypothetical protein
MGQTIEVPFAVQEGEAGASQNSKETLINMFAEVGPGGRSQLIRRQRPGLVQLVANSLEKRCIEKHKDLHYVVIGSGFYSFDGTSLTLLGNLVSANGRCTMVFNDNDEALISDGTDAYYWDGATLTVLSLPAGVTCGDLSYLGGYGVFNNPGTGQFYWTGLNDFSAVDALDFATAESIPDNLTTTFVERNELWLPGPTSTEIWQLTSGADSPFAPYTNLRMRRGTKAARSYAAEDNTTIWLGEDGIIYRADSYSPVRISTEAIEEAIGDCTATGIAEAYATIFTVKGRKFYVLTVPNQLTVMYNFATQLWNRARSYGSDSWNMLGSAGHDSDYFLTDLGICELSFAVNTDEGGFMERGGISAPGYADGKRLTIHEVFFDAEVGRAAINKNANVMMRIARDGEVFGNHRTRSLGATGNYKRRAVFRGCGQGRRPVVEFMCTDDVELTINGIIVNITADAS